MRFFSSLMLQSFSIAALALATAGGAQSAAVSTSARPSERITGKIDNAVTTRLAGTHPEVVDHIVVGARLASSTRLGNLHLVLSATDEQEAALVALSDQQQDKTSPNYHKWLTPDGFGQAFGAAAADVAKITAWLQDQGLTVSSVSKGNRIITFGGSVAQVEAAFQTEMHTVTLNGETHISNTTDVAVPAAFAAVVKGIARLNDIFPKPGAHFAGTAQLQRLLPANNYVSLDSHPLYGTATGTHYVAPGDVATIYNATPLTSAGTDGTGVTIDILAQSNINLADVEQFRSMFGLPKNDPTVILVGADPGENGDDGEAYLDAEWSGAVATGAKVNFVLSSPDVEDGGIDSSGLYAVDNNLGDIISLSYGGCELSNGASVTNFYNTLWEQAAAQGQTVFVSTGDSSADTCASSSASYATSGYGVNALGSSAYNVAVGGSEFVDYGQATYWGPNGTTIPFSNALSYIPEAPWNNSKIGQANGTYLNSSSTGTSTGSGIAGTGGGISIYTARPSWQTGSGISASSDPNCVSGTYNSSTGVCTATGTTVSGLHRLVPDIVNISANNHDGALFCDDSICSVTSSGGLVNAGIVGGTSVATPVSAGLQALVNEKNGGRQGNANYYYYALANAQYTASTTACQATLGTAAAPTVTLPASTCNFHDIVGGSNAVPTTSTDTTGIGFNAGVGYDPASGLGSFNITNVANNWSTVTFTATTTKLSISPAVGATHGTAQTINLTVAPTSGSGTPTGDFALIAQTTTPNGPFQYTLTNGSFSGLVSSSNAGTTTGVYGLPALTSALPAGSYNVYARYAGDGTYGASVSNAVPVVIGKETSSISSTSYAVAASTSYSVTPATTFTYGAAVYLDTFVTPASGSGVPTGKVVYTLAQNGTTVGSLTNALDPHGNTYFYAGQSNPNFYLKANYAALSPGSYTVTTAYTGDNNYSSSTNTISFTVTQLTPTVTFTGPADITSGATATFGYKIANSLGTSTAYPDTTVNATGTVVFTDTTSGTVLGTCTLASALTGATCTLSTTAITTAGANTISAVYSGDVNYAAATNTLTTTVGTLTAPTVTVTTSGTLTVGATTSLVATLAPTTATGTVTFFNNGVLLGTATVNGSGVASLSNAGSLPAGALPITAVYSGSSTYASATGSATVTIAKNSPTLTMSAPLNSTYGQNVDVDVDFTRSPTQNATVIAPTGTVTVLDSGTAVGTGTLIYSPSARYIASINIPTLTGGSHSLSVSYSGDSNFNTATAGPYTTTVAALTPTITLSTTTGASVYGTGSLVYLQAFIPASSALAVPTGTLTFTSQTSSAQYNATFSYNATLGGFVAILGLGGLSGSNTYIVSLAADNNYNAATSNSFTVLVTTNNVWVANGNGTVSGLTESGTAVTSSGQAGGGTAIAIDNAGDVWSLNKSASTVSEYTKTGAPISSGSTVGGLSAPTALAIDGSGLVWVTNGTGTLSVLSAPGTAVSSVAYKVNASAPTSINIDTAGNLWITNSGDNSVSEVIGAATPVTTPTTTAVTNSTLAAKP